VQILSFPPEIGGGRFYFTILPGNVNRKRRRAPGRRNNTRDFIINCSVGPPEKERERMRGRDAEFWEGIGVRAQYERAFI
jgi:hypothetical protein